jgi:hypothetical protein
MQPHNRLLRTAVSAGHRRNRTAQIGGATAAAPTVMIAASAELPPKPASRTAAIHAAKDGTSPVAPNSLARGQRDLPPRLGGGSGHCGRIIMKRLRDCAANISKARRFP